MSKIQSAILTLIIFSVIPGIGWSQLVEVNPKSGIYNSPIEVEIVSNGEYEKICYSLDGSEPDTNSPVYSKPIIVNSNSVLKVLAINTDGSYGSPTVASYFINPHHTLPIISLVTDPKNLWDDESGIYVKGNNAEDDLPYFGANFWQDWEIPVHIEMFEPDGSLAFSQFAGAKIFGGHSRIYPQKSLSIHTRKSYGKKNIKYQIFPDRETDKFSRLVLRNSGNDWNCSMIRDGVISKLFHPSIDQQAFRSAVLYINGQYWGIQNIREKINAEFIESHHNIDEEEITILENYGYPLHGSKEDYVELLTFITNNDLAKQENYEYVESKIDISNYIHYLTANIYIDNRDWPASNNRYWKQDTENGKWKWISYDRDFGLGYSDINKVHFNTLEFALEPDGPDWPNPPWSTFLLRSLIRNASFRESFINDFADQLNSRWRPENVRKNIQNLRRKIDYEISHHLERWDGSIVKWQKNIYEMNVFSKKRPEIMYAHIQSTFDIPENHLMNLALKNDQSGHILINSILPESYPWTGRYFEGIPIHLTAIPEPGYRFSAWEGDIQSVNEQVEVIMNGDMTIIAVFELENEELSSIVINEIFYKSEGKKIRDWIEIYNRGQSTINISNWTFKDEKHPEGFKIPANTIIQPGKFVIIARDKDNFREVYGQDIAVIGNINFGLSSFGECISILDPENNLADEVCYFSTFPWPDTGGEGSLALKGPNLSNSDFNNWFAHAHDKYGSPGNHNILPEPDLSFTVFPNPAQDYIILDFSMLLKDRTIISIYDLAGNLIENRTINDPGDNTFRLDFSKPIQPGIYMVSVSSNKHIASRRLFITQFP
jgi:hypothetical protein